MAITFTRATRHSVPLKIGITGPSGSGKTTAALKIARGLIGPDAPMAVLDTENGSASLYSDFTAFDVLDMNPPYQVAKFMAAIDAAVQGGYKALVIDSASHEWKELLIEKEALDARGGNYYTNWASITKKHEEFLKAIRNAPIHLILCLRSKEKHEIQEGQNGKKSVVKLGQGSEMRDGFEYELTTVFDLAMDHNAKTSKDRTRLFDGRIEQLAEATGRELAAWLTGGIALAPNTGEEFQAPAVATAPTPSMEPAPTSAPSPDPTPTFTVTVRDGDSGKSTVHTFATREDAEACRAKYHKPDQLLTASLSEAKASALAAPAETIGQVAANVTQAVKDAPAAVSAATDAFVDGMADGPAKLATPEECTEITDLAYQHKVNLDQLGAYMLHKGYMLRAKDWTSITKEGHTKALPHLKDDGKRRALIAFLASHHAAKAA